MIESSASTTPGTAILDSAAPFNPGLLAEVRERFVNLESDPVAGRRIYLESAGGSLPLRSVVARTAEVIGIPDSGGRLNPTSQHLAHTVRTGAEHVRIFLGACGGVLATGATGTELIWRLVRTVLLARMKGTIVFSSLEHPASYDAVHHWARATYRHPIEVPLRPEMATVGPEDYAQAVRPDTVLATVIHTSNVTGKRVDLEGIVAVIRAVAPDCFVVCDGIQHVAHGWTDVAGYGVDAYVISPYKMFSRRGGSFAWLSDRLATLPHESQAGAPETNWNLGGRDPSIYASFSEVYAHLNWLGGHFTNSCLERERVTAAMAAIGRHEAALIQRLLFGGDHAPGLAGRPGIRLVGGTGMADREGAVSFLVDGTPSADIDSILRDRGIRVHHRSRADSANTLAALGVPDCVRVSFCHYTTMAEINSLLEVLDEGAGRGAAPG